MTVVHVVSMALLSSGAAACISPSMEVRFHTLPRGVESPKPDSCRLVSRSPLSHIVREGPAKRGEVLEAMGSFSVSGQQAEFSQTCRID